MSWLRNHFNFFVYPAFMAAEKKSTEIGEPFHVEVSKHAPERLPTELKKLWTLCQEHEVKWTYDVREINHNSGSSKFRETARIHHGILRDTLDSAMASLRHERCERLFLGGRDVWTFVVLCEKRRIPYMFVPELSRSVVGMPQIKPFLLERGFTGRELFLDTGFAGSIPKNLMNHFPGSTFKFRLMSQSEQYIDVHESKGLTNMVDCDPLTSGGKMRQGVDRVRRRPNQLFPNRKTARNEALETEYLAKYWKTGMGEGIIKEVVGHAPDTLQKWKDHPDQGKLRRYSDAYGRFFAITDGEHAEKFMLPNVKETPGFYEWWQTLPEGVRPEKGEIVQYFSDKATIQRAALLTSQLWRGIPYWKARLEPDVTMVHPTAKYVPMTGNITVNSATNSATTAIYTTSTDSLVATNWIVTNPSITSGTMLAELVPGKLA